MISGMEKMSRRSREILRLIAEEPRLTPEMISNRLEFAPSTVKNTLGDLYSLELVERKAKGVYEASELGESLLEDLEKGER